MQPSNRAMIWYFWRLSRYNMLLLIAASVAAAYFVKSMEPGLPGSSFAYINLILQVFLITVFGGCLFMWDSESSFLPHPCLLTLPLATPRYLVFFYGYVILVVGVISCGAAALHLYFFGNVIQEADPIVVLQFWQMPLLCVALACLIQSMFHLSGIKNEFRVAPMAIAAEALAFACLMTVLDPGNMSGLYAACVAMLFAWVSSYNALTAHRRGGRHGGVAALLERFDLGRGRTSPFPSRGSALFWIGWRRYGRFFTLWALSLTLVGVVSYLVVVAPEIWSAGRGNGFNGGQFIEGALLITLPMVFVAAFLSHIVLLMRSHEDFLGAGRGYFLTLPVRSGALVRGRLWAMVLSYLLIVTAGTALVQFMMLVSPDFSRNMSLQFMDMALLSIYGLWLTLWLGLPVVLGYILTLLLIGVAEFLGFQHYNNYLAYGFALLFIAATAFFLFTGIRNGLMSRAGLLLFAVSMIIPVVLFVVYRVEFKTDQPGQFLVAVMLFGLFLPVVLPFVTAPVLVNWIRHR